MIRREAILPAAALFLFAGPCAIAPASAQSYGLGDQVLTVAAAAFRDAAGHGVIGSDGYLYKADPNAAGRVFYAPLRLPDGAEITRICLYARNEEAELGSVAFLAEWTKLTPGGQAPGRGTVPGSNVGTTFNFGYGVVCTDPMSYVFHDDADIDHDGTVEHLSHRLDAELLMGATPAFGGVRITWHRQVSPPPATATFGDVPTDHIFFDFIEALAASGITGGCNADPPQYCPDAPLTRGQMAVFLSKALGLHWTN
jgi:hypothetical protein